MTINKDRYQRDLLHKRFIMKQFNDKKHSSMSVHFMKEERHIPKMYH